MKPSFINDGTAAAFLNAGTSEGAKLAWEGRGSAKQAEVASLKAREASGKANSTSEHFDAAKAHSAAADMHEKAMIEARQKGDGRSEQHHSTLMQFHQSVAREHRDKAYAPLGTFNRIPGLKERVFIPNKERREDRE